MPEYQYEFKAKESGFVNMEYSLNNLKVIRMSYKELVAVSFAIWCLSLLFLGISTYSSEHQYYGYQILLFGWLSPLVFNFAWYANLFYLFGLISLARGKMPIGSPIIASVLSLDMFRYGEQLKDTGGSTIPVYGYGWGAILWLIAIYTLSIAAGKRGIEPESGYNEFDLRSARFLGVLLLSILVFGTFVLSVYQRIIANDDESELLYGVAFKRGFVCSRDNPEPVNPIQDFTGPLEIKHIGRAPSPFQHIKSQLLWGIPSIRVNKRDYFLDVEDESFVISVEGQGSPQAILEVNRTSGKDIRMKLTETSTSRQIVDFTWKHDKSRFYCPTYSTYTKFDVYPRRLLMEAIGIYESKPHRKKNFPKRKDRSVEGTIVGRTKIELISNAENVVQLSNGNAVVKDDMGLRMNCPENVGWKIKERNKLFPYEVPFEIDGTYYHLDRRSKLNYVTCQQGSVYLYRIYSNKESHFIQLQNRDIATFRKIWDEKVDFDKNQIEETKQLRLTSIELNGDLLQINLIDTIKDELIHLEAPFIHGESGLTVPM